MLGEQLEERLTDFSEPNHNDAILFLHRSLLKVLRKIVTKNRESACNFTMGRKAKEIACSGCERISHLPAGSFRGDFYEGAIEKVYRYESIYFTAIMVMVLPCIEWARALDLAPAKPRNR
jgi:hypothetical protein